MSTVTVRFEDTYECGHHGSRDVSLPAPAAAANSQELEDWFDSEEVWSLTGDPHPCGLRNDGYCHTATIVDAEDRDDLIGEFHEWVGR